MVTKEQKDVGTTKDYYEILKDDISSVGEGKGILKYLPDFYRILCNIVSNNKTSWYTRILANSALAYLVLEVDVIPDKESKRGYMDDLFIFSYVLREIRDKISKNIILLNIKGTNLEDEHEKIFDLIYKVYSESKDCLDGRDEDIINLVGLSKFNALDLLCANDLVSNITRSKKKLKLLYAMAAVIMKELSVGSKFKNEFRKSASSQRFNEYISNHPEYGEIKRYGAFLKSEK